MKMASVAQRESSFCDKDQNNVILNALYEQKQSSVFCDVIMKVCGREIYAHSNILAAASPYFHAFLSQDLPRQFSQRSPQVIEIQIDGSEPTSMYEEAVANVVDFIYTGKMKVRDDNVTQISEIAKIMQMDNVVQFCDKFYNAEVEQTEEIPVRSCGTQFDPPPTEQTTKPVSSTPKDFVDASTNTDGVKTAVDVSHGEDAPLTRTDKASTPAKMVDKRITEKPQTRTSVKKGLALEEKQKPLPDLSSHPVSTGRRRRGRPRKYPLVAKPLTKGMFESSNATGVSDDRTMKSTDKTINDEELMEIIADIEHNEVEGEAEGDTGETNTENKFPERRRSLRTPKPTAKLKGAQKRKALAPPKEDAKRGRPSKGFGKVTVDNPKDKDYVPPKVKLGKRIVGRISKRKVGIAGKTFEVQFCDKCGYKTTNHYHFRRHYAIHEGGKYTCDICRDFTAARIRELIQHKKEHKHENNICSFCEHQFDTRELLEEHLVKHQDPQPYFCPVCDVRFKSRTQLNLHLPKHSDEKPFVCDLCDMGFKWKHALKNHMITHSDKKDHLCDVCGYATAHKSQLKAHRLIHTGETFKCSFPNCIFQATKRQNLKYHMLTHTREKPHVCDICGQAFSLVKNMRRHMLLHSTSRPHSCVQCEFTTTRYDKLKEHMLKQHGIGSPPEKRTRISDLVAQGSGATTVQSAAVPLSPTATQLLIVQPIKAEDADGKEVVHIENVQSIDENQHNVEVNTGQMTELTADQVIQLAQSQASTVVQGQLAEGQIIPPGTHIVEVHIQAPDDGDGGMSAELTDTSSQVVGVTTSTAPAVQETEEDQQYQTVQVVFPNSNDIQYVQQVTGYVTQ